MDDEESKKYILQRMKEILNEEWAAEREITIDHLTKQIGMLEMKNNMFCSQFDTQSNPISEQNKIKIIQDLLDSKQNEVNSLQKNLSLKDKEISMLRMHQEGRQKKQNKTKNNLESGKIL